MKAGKTKRLNNSLYLQNGAALLLFVLVGLVSITSVFLTALNQQQPASAAKGDMAVLKTAHTALIGYASIFSDMNTNRLPGYLPCPDSNGDGLSNSPCGAVGESAIGRLPWQTLGLPPLRDHSGTCLWYAVSGHYKENPAGNLSVDTEGQFIIYDASLSVRIGSTPIDQAIAIVFAAGAIVPGQIRSQTVASRTECGSQISADQINRVSNYLESRNGINNSQGTRSGAGTGLAGSVPIPSNLAATVISAPSFPETGGTDFNDTMIWITPNDFNKVYQRMLAWVGNQTQSCLQTYSASNLGKYPWPAVLDGANSPDYADDPNQRFGRIANDLSNTALSGISASWPTGCFNWSWWNNWRELIFYAVDKNSAPTLISGTLVRVDTTATPMGLLIAGRRNSSQSRSSNSDKANINNYLESSNIPASGAGLIPPGNEDFQTTNLASSSDDYVCTATSCP